MDVNGAIREETPDLEQRVNELHGTMSNLAANLGAVDEQTRTNAGALAEQTVMLQGILRSLHHYCLLCQCARISPRLLINSP